MIRPTIGLPELGKDLFSLYLQHKYVSCLDRAGASVQWLVSAASPETLSETVESALTRCQGFLFPDGPDIQPKLYGQLRQPGSEKSNEARDNFEMALLLAALEAEKPVFCINRGMLLLNVAFGGTLYQDLKSRQQCEHFDFWHRSVAAHPVELDPDSFLAKQLKTDVLTVNSIHRQAIDNLGKRLWICADSPDGFPEALEMEDYPFCLAVQWNPEFMTRKTPVQRKLFQGFVDACRK